MPDLHQEQEVRKFAGSLQTDRYAGATFSFAGWRRDGLLRNIACRIVLTPYPPDSGWAFSDDVEELAIRRGWLSIEALPHALESILNNCVELGGESLILTRDQGSCYSWSYLVASPKGRKVIPWVSHSLVGWGENQYLFLKHDAISRVGARLRLAHRRPFDGWHNLASFLGEGGLPFDLTDSNTCLDFLAPIWGRIESDSTLNRRGALSVRVRCVCRAAEPDLHLLLGSEGPTPPREIALSRQPKQDLWVARVNLSPSPATAKLSLMLGNELADEVMLHSPTTKTEPRQQAGGPSSRRLLPKTPTEARTLVERCKRWAANNVLFASLIFLGAAATFIASTMKSVREVVIEVFHGGETEAEALREADAAIANLGDASEGSLAKRWTIDRLVRVADKHPNLKTRIADALAEFVRDQSASNRLHVAMQTRMVELEADSALAELLNREFPTPELADHAFRQLGMPPLADAPRVDDSDLNLRGIVIPQARARGALYRDVDLSGAILIKSALAGTRFESCNLTGCVLSRSSMQRCVMDSSNSLRNARLEGTEVKGARIARIRETIGSPEYDR